MKQFTAENFLIFHVKKEEENIKMREFLEKRGLSSRYIRRSVRQRDIYLNKNLLLDNRSLKEKDEVSISLGKESLNVNPQFRELDIIYEDEDLILINKEPHMVTHTAKDDRENTLLNYVGGYFVRQEIQRKVRFVNRLDRDTSGIIIVAKNSFAHSMVAKQMERGLITKKYKAICLGAFQQKQGRITGKIQLAPDGIHREIGDAGKEACTDFRVLSERKIKDRIYTLVDLVLHTGRTHQLRVHLQSLGHPIGGDQLYGGDDPLLDRQALHSYYLEFTHPRTGKKLQFEAESPEDFKRIFQNGDLQSD
ncbi:MAG: RluA family pseudouridine synthase [Tissierellia bacterium]|nr:RluA family pseudouridine synthase [Tissierellia bacterium]